MKRAFGLCLVVSLVTSSALASHVTIGDLVLPDNNFFVSLSPPANRPVDVFDSGSVRLVISNVEGASLQFDLPMPDCTTGVYCGPHFDIFSEDGEPRFVFGQVKDSMVAADAGLDFSAIEAIMMSPTTSSIDFGKIGEPLKHLELPHINGPVDLDNIYFYFDDIASFEILPSTIYHRDTLLVELSGTWRAVPEPATLTLFGLCFGLMHWLTVRTSRAR